MSRRSADRSSGSSRVSRTSLQDWPGAPHPEAVAKGTGPFPVVGAIAGRQKFRPFWQFTGFVHPHARKSENSCLDRALLAPMKRRISRVRPPCFEHHCIRALAVSRLAALICTVSLVFTFLIAVSSSGQPVPAAQKHADAAFDLAQR